MATKKQLEVRAKFKKAMKLSKGKNKTERKKIFKKVFKNG